MKIIVYGRDNSLHGLLSIEYILFFITMDFFILMRSPLIILIITKIMLSSTDITLKIGSCYQIWKGHLPHLFTGLETISLLSQGTTQNLGYDENVSSGK